MNWGNLPFHITERILYSAAVAEKPFNYGSNKWPFSIQKFGEVCKWWKNVIFSSRMLFPVQKCDLMFDFDLYKRAEHFTKAGYLPLVKNVHIQNPKAVRLIREYIEGNSLTHITVVIDQNWTDSSLELLTDILLLCSKVTTIETQMKISNQRMAVWFWKILLGQTHCNVHPKNLKFDIKFGTDELDWSFVTDVKCAGKGSLNELGFALEGPDTIVGPNWDRLAKTVTIRQLTKINGIDVIHRQFLDRFKTDCCKIQLWLGYIPRRNLTWLNKFRKIYICATVNHYDLDEIIQKINHSNAHLILNRAYRSQPDEIFYKRLLYQYPLIQALQATSVKTLTCKSNHLSTTLDCEDSLLDRWSEYLDLWKAHIACKETDE